MISSARQNVQLFIVRCAVVGHGTSILLPIQFSCHHAVFQCAKAARIQRLYDDAECRVWSAGK